MWSAQASGTTQRLYAVWGSDASHVWTAGSFGTILTSDGSVWSPQDNGTSGNLFGVWGSDASHLWTIGAHGTLLERAP